jgi:hypothetical protein
MEREKKKKLNVQLSVCSCKVAPNDHHLNNNNSRTLVIARSINHQHTPAMHDKESQISEQCEARQSARIVGRRGFLPRAETKIIPAHIQNTSATRRLDTEDVVWVLQHRSWLYG